MSKNEELRHQNPDYADDDRGDDLCDSPMMAHLYEALENGDDIGAYGSLTFAMVARYFLEDDAIVDLLTRQPSMEEAEARALIARVNERGYNPPKRERVLEWQARQDFPICPTPDDPQACNVYRELRFPQEVYDHIEEFWEEKAEGDNIE